ncbi:exodeoxyribonuclease 7 large subunit [Acinetobacter gyllenbergii]|jgi:exodeoxyribonuclease VII large subunit|uniref:Exodeoxyribonuclease 7 large subunit n=1 Tax=Acinetobacter gyllenbergii CIP 110306 = MTCC 11365 TaxID=1217657 RepID=A0A829HMI1_9GAMM|nr:MULTISPECIES: exodeoxyribonuclease VII large subunit [Acinetobacter]EPF90589.1 exodeoxyribonuclease VII large subunit [Acinetobacter gyllenbergii CIP 110306 = MTCC 11365]EPH33899.1 Exodeoxyribonuclease VII large subunit [Acinetobacter gyllenbergii CIP 110306 = MTCC 11365]MCU4377178.1 exodeoxyribonuclease VII large subunit [Acinetobacter haemolyticus]MEB3792763.1 exodeoxyribonuclease VII large subunit [Acinetobacter sp. IK40]WEI18447.1 exodeoxyribonuclease VII large subunit [Acinetobacter pr
MSEPQFSLSDYLSTVQEIIRLSFDEPVWVKAEIRNLSIKGGHYYLELAEKEEDTDKVIASCKATIWKSTAVKIVLKFERESGIELSKDLNVLIRIKARFDPQYGFSVNIEDIDSSFTLGDIAKRYQQILSRLSTEGLVNLNKSLSAPFDIENVLVIAPENAAGLGDFRKDADALNKAGVCHFVYCTATFQGNTAANSIMESLSSGLRQWAKDYAIPPDLIVIIRGGGAVNDLAYLNDYDLAALLCKRKVPIWVGIGHEKDRTILDEIAHRSFDTPSKVITGIRNVISERSQDVMGYLQTIKLLSQHQITAYQGQNDQLMNTIKTHAQNQINTANRNLDLVKSTTQYFSQQQLKLASTQIESLVRETLLQNPKNVLAKGYAIVRSQNKAIRSVQQVGSTVSIEMQDGYIHASVSEVINHE